MKHTRPRILYVITDLEVGGVPLHLRRLALAVRERGFEPAVVSLAPPGPVGQMLEEARIEVESCGGRGGWDFRVIGRLAQIIRRRKPDLLHALLFHANFAARRAARKAGLPRGRVICEIQTVEVERRWHLLVDRFTHCGCRCTIGNSQSVIDHLADHAHIPRDRLRLIRGGIEPERLQQAEPIPRRELGYTDEDKLVLWVGRLDPVKGLEPLLRAFVELGSALHAHLLLVGEGPLRSHLEQQIAELNLQARVRLPGTRNDVPNLLKSADVFVFPSRTEGLPNALLEAMAAGCPIVATDVPGCRDLIEPERTGLLVPYGDTSALTCALTQLLEDRPRAHELGAEAAKVAASAWTSTRTFDEYAALYREALTGR